MSARHEAGAGAAVALDQALAPPAAAPATMPMVEAVPLVKAAMDESSKWIADRKGFLKSVYHYGAKFDVPVIPNIDSAILAASDDGAQINMDRWHCGTAHCRAGWAVVLGGVAGARLEARFGPFAAGALIYAASRPGRPIPSFSEGTQAEALADLRRCAALEEKEALADLRECAAGAAP